MSQVRPERQTPALACLSQGKCDAVQDLWLERAEDTDLTDDERGALLVLAGRCMDNCEVKEDLAHAVSQFMNELSNATADEGLRAFRRGLEALSAASTWDRVKRLALAGLESSPPGSPDAREMGILAVSLAQPSRDKELLERAQETLEKVAETSGDDPNVLLAIGEAALISGNTDVALTFARKFSGDQWVERQGARLGCLALVAQPSMTDEDFKDFEKWATVLGSKLKSRGVFSFLWGSDEASGKDIPWVQAVRLLLLSQQAGDASALESAVTAAMSSDPLGDALLLRISSILDEAHCDEMSGRGGQFLMATLQRSLQQQWWSVAQSPLSAQSRAEVLSGVLSRFGGLVPSTVRLSPNTDAPTTLRDAWRNTPLPDWIRILKGPILLPRILTDSDARLDKLMRIIATRSDAYYQMWCQGRGQALDTAPSKAEHLLEQAFKAMKDGDQSAAMNALKAITSDYPSDPAADQARDVLSKLEAFDSRLAEAQSKNETAQKQRKGLAREKQVRKALLGTWRTTNSRLVNYYWKAGEWIKKPNPEKYEQMRFSEDGTYLGVLAFQQSPPFCERQYATYTFANGTLTVHFSRWDQIDSEGKILGGGSWTENLRDPDSASTTSTERVIFSSDLNSLWFDDHGEKVVYKRMSDEALAAERQQLHAEKEKADRDRAKAEAELREQAERVTLRFTGARVFSEVIIGRWVRRMPGGSRYILTIDRSHNVTFEKFLSHREEPYNVYTGTYTVSGIRATFSFNEQTLNGRSRPPDSLAPPSLAVDQFNGNNTFEYGGTYYRDR